MPFRQFSVAAAAMRIIFNPETVESGQGRPSGIRSFRLEHALSSLKRGVSMRPTIRLTVFYGFLMILMLASSQAWSLGTPPQRSNLSADAAIHVHRFMTSAPDDVFVTLKNGLTVLVHPIRNSEVVSAQVFVRAGSIYEGNRMGSGISHYLEHVVSGGTTRSFTEDEATTRLERIGGQTNAYTSYDRTVYFINTAGQHWQEALDLLLSYVFESTLDPAEVLREKSVIQQEMKMGENSPGRELWKLFMETAYRKHPVRSPIIGFEEIFVQQDRDALLEYYLERYRPDNAVVVVAGAVNPDEVIRFVGTKTSDVQRTAAPPAALPDEPPQLNLRWQERELPFARLTQAMIGFPSVALHHPDLYALDVLAMLLGQGRTSRLYARLKDDENRVLSVSASNWTPSYVTGQFIVSLTLAPQHWPSVLDSVHEEIEKFKAEPVSPDELEKAKKQVVAQHIFSQETASQRAGSIASSFFDTGDPYFDTLYVENIRTVTAEQIQRVAAAYLDAKRASVAAVHPRGTGEDTAGEEADAPLQVADASGVILHEAPNGLRVLLKEEVSLPLVTIQLYGLGGLFLEDGQPPGIAAFTSSLLTAGTTTRSKMDIAQAIEEIGGSIESRSDNNTYRVSIKLLKEDLELGLDILADVLQNATFPPDEIEKLRKETLLSLETLDANWQMEIMRLFRQNYFEKSPFRHDRLGTPESVEALTREDILKFYEKMVRPERAVLAVFGDLDPAQTLSLVNKKFSTWRRESALSLPTFEPETANIRESRVVEKTNDKSAAALFVGTNGLEVNDELRPVLDVLDAVLSGTGYPGGRLFKGLRGGGEDLVYMVGAFPFYGKQAGFYGVLTQTTLANLDRVQEIVLKNLEDLKKEPLPDAELERMKDLLIAMRRLNLESLEARAQSAVVNEVLGLGWDYDVNYPEMVRKVSATQVQELAAKLFGNTLIVRTIPENPVEILEVPPPMSDVPATR